MPPGTLTATAGIAAALVFSFWRWGWIGKGESPATLRKAAGWKRKAGGKAR